MKKKRFLKLILIACVSLMTFMLASCSFSLEFSDCSGVFGDWFPTTQEPPAEPPEEPQAPSTSFSFSIVKKRSYYYPTFSGVLEFDFYPERITLETLGRTFELKPDALEVTEQGKYVFTFQEKVVLFDKLVPGEYVAQVFAYKGETTADAGTVKFTVDKELSLMGDRMDQEDNWGAIK